MPTLDVVCVEWKSGALLAECLRSIAQSDLEGLRLQRVVVIDNSEASSPATPPEAGLPLTVVGNARNVGFGAACNQGARDSQAEYLVFLNPDIRLEHNALAQVIARMETAADARVGIAGARLTDAGGQTLRTCARLPTPWRMLAQAGGFDRLPGLSGLRHFMSEWDHGEERDVPQIMGACMIVRRTAFEALGGFDERFFLYYEDVDLCARAWQCGWKCRFYAAPSAIHLGGGTTQQIKALRMFYNARSRILYARKHFGAAAATVLWLTILLSEPVARSLLAIFGGQPGQIRDILRATGMLAVETRSIARTIFARGD